MAYTQLSLAPLLLSMHVFSRKCAPIEHQGSSLNGLVAYCVMLYLLYVYNGLLTFCMHGTSHHSLSVWHYFCLTQWRMGGGGGGGGGGAGAGIRERQNRREIINYFANAKSRTGT